MPPLRPRPSAARVLALLATAGTLTLAGAVPSATAAPATPGVPDAAPTSAAPSRVAPVRPKLTQVDLDGRTAGTSDTVQIEDAAPVVGLTWAAKDAPPAATPVAVRARTSAGWGPWVETEVTESQSESTRVGIEPVWVGAAPQALQVRVTGLERAAKARSGRLELIDPGSTPTPAPASAPAPGDGARTTTTATSATTAASAAAQPTIISRAGWGADESLRSCSPSYGSTVKALTLHHTAGSNSYTAAESASIVRGIYAYHTRSLGWCDIGYNALVDKYGQIFEGRAGGIDRPVTGAHAGGFNTGTWGVSVLGSYSSAAATSATKTALTDLFAWKASTFYTWPIQTVTLTSGSSSSRYPSGTDARLPFIFGHRDTHYTECPGDNLYSWLPSLRTAVAQKTGYGDSPVYQAWIDKGGVTTFGAVSRGERVTPFGVRTVFATGRSLWSTPNGVRYLGPGTGTLYEERDGEQRWGAPVRDEYPVTGGYQADFDGNATIAWVTRLSRSVSVTGMLRTSWMDRGGASSPLGLPSAEPVAPTSTGVSQNFVGGQLQHKNRSVPRAVLGPILTEQLSLGGPGGRLGYPISEERRWTGGTEQYFEGGRIRRTSSTGAITVTYR